MDKSEKYEETSDSWNGWSTLRPYFFVGLGLQIADIARFAISRGHDEFAAARFGSGWLYGIVGLYAALETRIEKFDRVALGLGFGGLAVAQFLPLQDLKGRGLCVASTVVFSLAAAFTPENIREKIRRKAESVRKKVEYDRDTLYYAFRQTQKPLGR